jgi:hypothetical protein
MLDNTAFDEIYDQHLQDRKFLDPGGVTLTTSDRRYGIYTGTYEEREGYRIALVSTADD